MLGVFVVKEQNLMKNADYLDILITIVCVIVLTVKIVGDGKAHEDQKVRLVTG